MSAMQFVHWAPRVAGTVLGLVAMAAPVAQAQTAAPSKPSAVASAPLPDSVNGWLERIHEASRNRAYTGTFVVSSGPQISASKISHICDGSQQMERIETLTGAPRITLRRNDDVMTFVSDQKVVLRDRREALRLFPALLRDPGRPLAQYYGVRAQGSERVAGFDAWVVDFTPRDALRYGYRFWSEKQTGLVVKLQTRDDRGQVLEQVSFTDLQLDAPVKMDALARQMDNTAGYRVVKSDWRKTTPQAEGWTLKGEVPGFQSMTSYARGDASGKPAAMFQWVFSDGLASVSLFLEPFDAARHGQDKSLAAGATHAVTRRVGDHWVTVMGEVPRDTLIRFAQAIERTR